MVSENDVWRRYASMIPGVLAARPTFRPEHGNGEVVAQPDYYTELARSVSGLDQLLDSLRLFDGPDLADPELAGISTHLLCELMALGDPVDRLVSNFSAAYYLEQHSDIARAQMNPLDHYLRWGYLEGWRQTLSPLRRRLALGGGRKPNVASAVAILAADPDDADTSEVLVALAGALDRDGFNVILLTERSGGTRPQLNRLLTATLPPEGASWILRYLLNLELAAIVCLDTDTGEFAGVLRHADVAVLDVQSGFPDTRPLSERHFAQVPLFACCHFASADIAAAWENLFRDHGVEPGASKVFEYFALPRWSETREGTGDLQAMLERQFGSGQRTRALVLSSGRTDTDAGFGLFRALAAIAAGRKLPVDFLWLADHGGASIPPLTWPGVSGLAVWHRTASLPGLIEVADCYVDLGPAERPSKEAILAVGMGATAICFEGSRTLSARDAHPRLAGQFIAVPDGDLNQVLAAIPRRAERGRRVRSLGASGLEGFCETIMDSVTAAIKMQQARDLDTPGRLLQGPRQAGTPTAWLSMGELKSRIRTSAHPAHTGIEIHEALANVDLTSAPFSIHYHVHDPGNDICEDFQSLSTAFRLARETVFTVTSRTGAELLAALAEKSEGVFRIEQVPNLGRDILPFLQVPRDAFLAEPDMWWCHVHQKKSRHLINGDDWRQRLFRSLLGGGAEGTAGVRLDRADLGLVAPVDRFGRRWRRSHRLRDRIASPLNQPLPDEPLMFPVGNMFFCRARLATAMLDLFGAHYPWPEEPIPIDGTEYHLIERLWPLVAQRSGLRSGFFGNLS
ncbi:hypothetical protein JWJ88_18430 [Paracoccus methylovorus]|uniref:Uncharacterized protein n=1 Tax=Paracoccus methylovorus TaxID=2812658 RepID=A0ABX7JN54_9RHOB|nr:rhamnan synthesis F family protein [Paracoccus methylovorus]QRZ14926.1 hypothetical protein JWJ88_18430 [Paracoccus methylovorus]